MRPPRYRNERGIKERSTIVGRPSAALHIQATVHVQHVSGDVAGLFTRQKPHGRGDIFRLSDTLQRDVPDQVVLQFLRQFAESCRSR